MERRELKELLAPEAVEALERRLSAEDLEVLRLFAEQAVHMGICYRTLGIGWQHPSTRLQYRSGRHKSTRHAASQRRQQGAKRRLEARRHAYRHKGCMSY